MQLAKLLEALAAKPLQGESAVREAAASEWRAIIDLVGAAVRQAEGGDAERYIPIVGLYADRVIVERQGRLFAYPYQLSDDNTVQLGQPEEVVTDHKPVAAMREAQGEFLEAADGKGLSWRIRVIRAGRSKNNVLYPDAVLREAVPLFEGTRCFVKPDAEHIKGGGKSFAQLIGRLVEAVFVPGKATDSGEVHATLQLLESAGDVPAKLREAHARGMAELFGFSIDAVGRVKRGRGNQRVAEAITQVNSVDLIIEPGADGRLLSLVEAVQHPGDDTDMKLREQMLTKIREAHGGKLPDGLDESDETAVLEAYNGVLARLAEANPRQAAAPTDAGAARLTEAAIDERFRLVEARSHARVAIAESGLPDLAKARLRKQFGADAVFTEAAVDQAIADEREYLGKLTESGHVRGLGDGSFVEGGEDQADKLTQMWDDFFDPKKKQLSLRECYIQTTGDRNCTGQLRECDARRLREAAGALPEALREAVSSTTFSNILGDSITRRLLADYGDPQRMYNVWRRLAMVTRVNDFRTQERTRLGGYGDLPTVAQKAPYTALTTPGDEKATYAVAKRGGTEEVTIETIANDDVGVVRQIPIRMSRAAQRTLAKFVLDFLKDNPTVYDGDALFHANHANLGTAALDATSLAAARLRMLKQGELSSAERLGITPSDLWVPVDLEETAFDLFRKTTNNDADFIESIQMMVHPVWYWTDANNWYLTADVNESPTVEIAFLNGNEEPELFVQDQPNQGSLFSNDVITYKLRHVYGGNVTDFRAADGSVVA